MQIPKEKIPKLVPVEAIRRIEKERNGTVAEATALQVQTQSDSDLANLYLRKITAAVKVVNDRFEEIMLPQNKAIREQQEAKRQIQALRDEILIPLIKAKEELSKRLMAWRESERKRIAEEKAKIEAKRQEREELKTDYQRQGHRPPGPEPVLEEPMPLESTDTTKVRNVWDFEIIDKAAVPDEYKEVNTVLIRRAMGDAPRDKQNTVLMLAIPGVRFFRKEVPVFA